MTDTQKNQVATDDAKAKDDEAKGRDRWAGPVTFVLAAIGSAIGLGNFWRFPYLCYKHGGGLFFVPYLLSLFLLGLPMLMLEFSLGQKFQRGDIGVFRAIHPRLAGIGMASVFAAFAITLYYIVIIGWAVVYFFAAFQNPLPWSSQYITPRATPNNYNGPEFFPGLMFNSEFDPNASCNGEYITTQYFFNDVVKIMNDDCTWYDTGDSIFGTDDQEARFAWGAWFGTLFTWFACFLCVFKGVKSSSYVVWFTVPIPVIFIFFMVLRGLTLENADEGIRMYLLGEGFEATANQTWQERLSSPIIWTEACAQIFFSIGVCMGIMTSYASYNPRDKAIIGPATQVSLGNSSLSFFAGFAVFSTVGYLKGIDSPIKDKTSGMSLAFVAYPTALDTLPYSNGWAVMLALTLFTLGLDSAFSLIEAATTVIGDTTFGKNNARWLVAAIMCGIGAVISTVFCSNWGFTYFDVVDHYLANYLMLIVGVLQCFGACWMYKATKYRETEPDTYKAVKIQLLGYWIPLLILGVTGNFIENEMALPISILAFWIIQIIVWIVSFFVSKLGFKEWYKKVFFYGARDLAIMISKASIDDPEHTPMWRYPFEIWWSFSMKYFFSWAVWTLCMRYFRNDLPINEGETYYGGYHGFWQIMGFLYPFAGLIMFVLAAIMCTEHDPDVDLAAIEHDEDEDEPAKPKADGGIDSAPAAVDPSIQN